MTIIDFKYKYIFIANMKTASTSIHDYYKNYLSNNNITSKESINVKPIGKHDTYQDIKRYLDKLKIDINDFYIFGFVRDPVKRIKSCFLYEYKNKYHKYLLNNSEFNKYIRNNGEKHFWPVYKVFYNENLKLPNNVHIFKMENLYESIKIINKSIGFKDLDIKIKIMNSTPVNNLIIEPVELEILKKRYKSDFTYYKDQYV